MSQAQRDPEEPANPPGSDSTGREPPTAPERHFWLADLSVRQPVFITMLAIAALVVGGILYTRLSLELFPDISLPIVVVQTTYPGAGPEEVERTVSKVVEDAVASLAEVEGVRSTSRDSVSLVVIEFGMRKDGKEAADEVRARINSIRNGLPTEAHEPIISRFDFNAMPVLSIAVSDSGGERSLEGLRTLVDDVLKPRVERLPSVGSVDVIGGVTREVHVDLDLPQLQAHRVAPQQIVQAIRAENVALPSGTVRDGDREETMRTTGEARTLADLGDVPVLSRPGAEPLRLRNVAGISEGPAERKALSRLDGRESLVLSVRKQSRGNTVAVADAVKAEIEALEREYPTLSFALAYDGSTFTRESIEDVQTSLLLGAILAALVVLLFFRDLRSTLVTVAGLPVVLAGTFAAMEMLGMSLNIITLMALSLSVGMLIDDAIVVRENIFRHIERGESARVAASRGTGEIALAVVAVSSTIVAVFLPIAFTEGIAGQFLRDFGVTISVAVLLSLVEAFTLAPMLSSVFVQSARRAAPGRRRTASGLFAREYRRVLGWSLRHRPVIILAGALSLGVIADIFPRMVFAFSPNPDQGEFGLNVELPPGSRLVETDRVVRSLEDVLREQPEVAHVFTTVGDQNGTSEVGTLRVELRERGGTTGFVERVRPELDALVTAGRLTIDLEANSPTSGSAGGTGAVSSRPIQFSVQGDDFADLDVASAALVERLREVPGASDVDRSLKSTRPGRTIAIDRDRAANEGVTAAQVGATVRTLVNGEKAGTFRGAGDDVDIVVRLGEQYRDNLPDILGLPIITSKGQLVELSKVANLAASNEPGQIDRYNRQRQIVVGASYLGRSEGQVLADARAAAAALDVPAGVTVQVSGSAKSQDEMFSSLGVALLLSVMFVYMILASQFGSFVHPFTIMLALPFSFVGALAALYFGGFAFDMLGMIGIILLMGLVTKNSILVVEFANQLRATGLSARAAMLEAGPIRLRPIVMTTLAMIFGMLPVALGLGAGSELRRPMGVSIIGGLVTSTLLTLVVVPVAYTLIDDLSALARRRPAARPLSRRAALARRALRWGAMLGALALLGFGVARWMPVLHQTDGPRLSAASDPAPRPESEPAPVPAPTAGDDRQRTTGGWVSVEPIAPAASPAAGGLPAGIPAGMPSGAAGGAPATQPATPAGEHGPRPTAQPSSPGGTGLVADTGGFGLNVRSAPESSATLLTAIEDGARVRALGEERQDADGRTWVKVVDSSGATGWVAKEYLAAGGE